MAALLAVIVLYTAFQAASIWHCGAADEKRPADVAIVLGAGTYNGEVSPVYQERIRHGVWLYENGYVKKLILTGGYGEGSSVSDAAAAHYQVAGLVREIAGVEGDDPRSRIARRMDYRLLPAPPGAPCPRDALRVCRLLDLDPDLLSLFSENS